MQAVKTQISITRELIKTTPGIPATDGAGVEMTRIIGTPDLDMLDPFLLLDSFESDQPQDYVGGFPDHPHRGFETVTYLLEGRMRHKDSAGNEDIIEANGVQWMTAGKGIVHSEMPEQEDGLLMGFQLWVNLPMADKMTEPAYQGFSVSEIPIEQRDNGMVVRVISGRTDEGTVGPVVNNFVKPTYLDVALPAGKLFEQVLDSTDNAFIFVIEGDVKVGEQARVLGKRRLGVLSDGERVTVTAGNSDSRFLLVAAQPLNEPVARGGPFVMNTRQEVLQAFEDFRNNRL